MRNLSTYYLYQKPNKFNRRCIKIEWKKMSSKEFIKNKQLGCNATFNNISVISWCSQVLLVEESEYQEKRTDRPQITDKTIK